MDAIDFSRDIINRYNERETDMKRQLSVSMMCTDFGDLNGILDVFKEEHVDYLHIDIMDGHFVPNIMLGVSYVDWLRKATDIPLDFHLMVDEPASKLDWFPIRKGDIVTVHVESDWNALSALIQIRKLGAKAVLAISPQTPTSSVVHLLDYVDGVCVMLVIPGYSGQAMITGMEEKICELAKYREEKHATFFIEVDGHVNKDNIRELENAGAEIFVAGTSLLGKDPAAYRERVRLFYSV